VYGALKSVENGFRLIGLRIEKQNLAADFIDGNHAPRIA
jgi:hypothetical protein